VSSSSTDDSERETDGAGRSSCPICGGIGYVRTAVPVGHPAFGKLTPCTCRAEQLGQKRVSQLREQSELRFLERMTFGSFTPEAPGLTPEQQANLRWAFEEARSFAQDPKGWLVLKGGYGCGKTHLGAAIANQCVETGKPVMFITVPDLLDHLRAAFGPSSNTDYDTRFEQVRSVPVLVLDDLGTEYASPWAREKLFQVFNYRYNARLATVVTTNHELEDIPVALRSRVVDPDLTHIVSITAPDYRRSGIGQHRSDLSSLGLHSHQTFESFDLRKGELPPDEQENLEQAVRIARDFAGAPNGWLVLTGTYGTGKTHLAAAIANYRDQHGTPALFVLVPDLLDHLRATFNPQSPVPFDQRFEEVRRAPFLVLDDLGTESATAWAREKVYQLFDFRYNASLPTVVTTAKKIEQLERMDPRLLTRILDISLCTIFAVQVPPYRGGARRR
jgi:DNA replication protein DnaC